LPGKLLFTLSAPPISQLTAHSLSTDKKPWPSCVEYDEQGTVHVCVIFYNTTFSETEVSGCLKLGVLVQAEIIIPLKCFTIPRPRAVAERGQNNENMITQK